MTLTRAVVAVAVVATSMIPATLTAAPMDPAPAEYAKALEGKRVLMVPMAMGFDLAQGWAAILQREVDLELVVERHPRPERQHRHLHAGAPQAPILHRVAHVVAHGSDHTV